MEKVIEHSGVVQRVDGQHVHVLIEQQSACAGCHAKAACTAADKSDKVIAALMVDASIVAGDRVVVSAQKRVGIKAVILFYVIPFVLMLLTMLLVDVFTPNELIIGASALAILLPYYAGLRLCNAKLEKDFRFYARKEIND